MTEQYEVNWKNYYQILEVSPRVALEGITAAYERLAHLYHQLLSPGTNESQSFSVRMADIDEAYEVLSDSDRRAAYDLVFEVKYGSQEAEEPTDEEVIDSMAIMAQEVSKRRVEEEWRVLGWSKLAQRAIAIVIISLLLTLVGGSSFAIAQPEHILATPFKSVALAVGKASYAAIGLIEEIRGVIATYERSIVSAALQSMRVIEGLRVVPAVTVPTNDMAYFPSPENCLFPNYLDKRFSQFKYTVDSDGIVSVDTSTTTTNAFLKRIEQRLKELTESE